MSGSTQNAYGTSAISELPTSGGVFAFQLPAYAVFNSSPLFAYTPSTGVVGTDPNALAALQNNFTTQGAAGLAAITSIGAAEYAGQSGLFTQWASQINTLSVDANSIFKEVANKSATACSGFFGCLF